MEAFVVDGYGKQSAQFGEMPEPSWSRTARQGSTWLTTLVERALTDPGMLG